MRTAAEIRVGFEYFDEDVPHEGRVVTEVEYACPKKSDECGVCCTLTMLVFHCFTLS